MRRSFQQIRLNAFAEIIRPSPWNESPLLEHASVVHSLRFVVHDAITSKAALTPVACAAALFYGGFALLPWLWFSQHLAILATALEQWRPARQAMYVFLWLRALS